MTYLGILIYYRRLTNAEWKVVEERLQKHLSNWKGKLLSVAGRLVLINFALTNMVLYMLSFFQVPKGATTVTLLLLKIFLARRFGKKKKYRLVKWNVVCRPRDQGGLGIHDLEAKNIALLGKWLYKLLIEDGVWQILLRRKYIGSKALSQIN
jgi:hypothetical protein